jgi:outer membrane protein insertion porin family
MVCLGFAACSGTKLLPADDKLYLGATINLLSADKIENRQYLKTIAKNAVKPIPNKSFFGFRPKLWINLKAQKSPGNKIYKWLNKYGEAPVLMSDVKPAVTSGIIDAKFFNNGIFESYTEYKTVEKKHTYKVLYISHVHKQYTFKELIFSISDDSISKIILSAKEKSFIKPGDVYNLDVLKGERVRIDAVLKEKGYFYFSPEYLIYKADSSKAEYTISLRLTLKDSIPKNALTAYRINNVFIDQDYSLDSETPDKTKDTLKFQNSIFLGKESEMNIRPGVILRSVYLRKNEIYTRKNHNITLNRLMSIGNFKFVSVKFSDSDTIVPGYLDVDILMTPMTKRTFRAELDFVSKSNDYMGPRMNLSYLNRNTYRGAELLNLTMAGSYEAQFTAKTKNLFSYSVAPQVELYVPGLLVPFKIIRTNTLYVPKTRFSLSYNYLKRVNYFDMRTSQLIYGYKWKENIKKEHEFIPINVSYSSIANKSAIFTKLLDSIPFLKKSYEEQFIAGARYSFTYNEQVGPDKKIQFYFHLSTETSGNAFSLVKLISGEKATAGNPSKIIGSVYSQFAKISLEGRANYNFADKNKLAFRVFAGAGNPYGNSSVLPYNKQFFSGGPNGLRAFLINSVGPGSYHQNSDIEGFLQLGGDIKLESNAEYRFGIYRFLKGAFFVDAGNIWLIKSNPAIDVKPFSFSTFYNEIAVGAGIGLRIDVSFFILRFDLATPLRKPWLEENSRWVINKMNFGDSSWRKDNIVLNVAIGYPF